MTPRSRVILAVGLSVLALSGGGLEFAAAQASTVRAATDHTDRDDRRLAIPETTRTYVYRDGEVFVALATPGRITDIVLEAGERLVGTGAVAAGDTARWVIGDTTSGAEASRRVHVLVKPTALGLATNLLINTDRRTYHLDLRSVNRAWLTQVAWRYPDAAPLVRSPVAAPVALVPAAAPPDIAALNFAYRIKGPRVAWRPSRVFDDGARTCFEFPPNVVMSDLPPLFTVGSDGKTVELVNYRVAGRRIVVDRVLDHAELRLGQGHGQRRVRILREAGR